MIVGQGLAGSLLAWHLIAMGRKVLVVDRDEPYTSSKVAAGLVTPISGQQFSLAPGIEGSLQCARKTYWEMEEATGSSLFHYQKTIRFFDDEAQRARWEKRSSGEEFSERYASFFSPLEFDSDLFHGQWGGIEVNKGGWLDLPQFLETMRQFLLERLSYAVGNVASSEISIHPGDGVQWRNVFSQNVIFCEGWKGNENRFFRSIPMNNARGDILRVRCPGVAGEERILSRRGWMVPMGEGIFRAGSSYDHDFSATSPTSEGREIVEQKIRGIIKSEYEVLDHDSAVRPIIRRSQVFMGRHPENPDIVFFNGMGSKGVTNGPLMTHVLAEHLVEGKPLDREVDIREQFSFD